MGFARKRGQINSKGNHPWQGRSIQVDVAKGKQRIGKAARFHCVLHKWNAQEQQQQFWEKFYKVLLKLQGADYQDEGEHPAVSRVVEWDECQFLGVEQESGFLEGNSAGHQSLWWNHGGLIVS